MFAIGCDWPVGPLTNGTGQLPCPYCPVGHPVRWHVTGPYFFARTAADVVGHLTECVRQKRRSLSGDVIAFRPQATWPLLALRALLAGQVRPPFSLAPFAAIIRLAAERFHPAGRASWARVKLVCWPGRSRSRSHLPAMLEDPSRNLRDHYDVVVIGGGLGGMTAANVLARAGRSVLLAEQHFKLGGLATWFRRGENIFDVALHGFPVGMIKSCRRYWSSEIADSIVQLKDIRFDNPMFSLSTTFDRQDFTRLLVERFRVPAAKVDAFFDAARNMNFYDDQTTTTGQLFERFFPGRDDVVRLLMEPITYANGSTLEDPALTYGIVFSNFMSKGVYTFQGGTDRLIDLMGRELQKSGVDVRTRCAVEKIHTTGRRVEGVTLGGRCVKTSGGRLERQSAGHDLQPRRPRALGPRFPRSSQGRSPEQLQHAGLHGPEARAADRRKPVRRPAVQFRGPGVPHRSASEPQHHEPHVLVLLSEDRGRGRIVA